MPNITSDSGVCGRRRTFAVVPLGLGSRLPKKPEFRRALFTVDTPSEADRSCEVETDGAVVVEGAESWCE